MEVTLLQQTAHTDYNASLLQIRLVGYEEARTVRHYRLTCWPVQGVPQTTKPTTDFLRCAGYVSLRVYLAMLHSLCTQ